MKFNPFYCPSCGRPAKGTRAVLHATSVFTLPGDLGDPTAPDVAYEGTTEPDWDTQMTERCLLDNGDSGVILVCSACPTQWAAAFLEGDPLQPPDQP